MNKYLRFMPPKFNSQFYLFFFSLTTNFTPPTKNQRKGITNFLVVLILSMGMSLPSWSSDSEELIDDVKKKGELSPKPSSSPKLFQNSLVKNPEDLKQKLENIPANFPDQLNSKPRPEQQENKYHKRETHCYVAGKILEGEKVYGFGPKPREGGLGPYKTIEISPWVKSVKWIKNIGEGYENRLEYIFDPKLHSVYVGVNPHKVQGHCCLSDMASAVDPYGGEIYKFKGYFRTNELSGHYGDKWHDAVRFKFIKLMAVKGISVLHEPWVRDSILQEKHPNIYLIKLSNLDIDYYRNILGNIAESKIFANASNEKLSIYQDNFLRKFGNSFLNPAFYVSIFVSPFNNCPSKELYEKDNKKENLYNLKKEYRGKGTLDKKFKFIDAFKLEGKLFEWLKK